MTPEAFGLRPSAFKIAAALVSLSVAIGCSTTTPNVLTIATTSSVQNSGLLDRMLPAVEEATGLTVRVHATGSGRALRMLADGDVDAIISHSPDAEASYLQAHPAWSYRKWAYNSFAVVGPENDPAGVRDAVDVPHAFRLLADSSVTFVSRGDASGTHEREEQFWTMASRRPGADRLLVSGRGMAQALRHASEVRGYTLTDLPTYWQLGSAIDLSVLFENNPALLNTYAVIHPPGNRGAETFVSWWFSDAGRAALESFLIDGRRAFEAWPNECASSVPTDVPGCQGARMPRVPRVPRIDASTG